MGLELRLQLCRFENSAERSKISLDLKYHSFRIAKRSIVDMCGIS